MAEETITIPMAEYKRLLKGQEWLGCLNAAGIDNWEGIEQAVEMLEQIGLEAEVQSEAD